MKFSDKYIVDEITDTHYFYMIENQVRERMPSFECGLALPKALALLKLFNIKEEELKEYPIEGYYYKSWALKHYFTIIRNLQHNKDVYSRVRPCAELDYLKYICHQDIFGIQRRYLVEEDEDAPLKRRYDILTITMEDESLFDLSSPRPWTIASIMAGMSKHFDNRINLVEQAYLTGNPRCLCCGSETNALYRMFAMASGCYIAAPDYVWSVSAEVQSLGEKLVDKYNELFGLGMVKPTIFNHTWLKKVPELPRVSLLGKILATDEKYYWILDAHEMLTEKYTIDTITTESMLHEQL